MVILIMSEEEIKAILTDKRNNIVGIHKQHCDKCGKYKILSPTIYGPYNFVCDECLPEVHKSWCWKDE